MCGIVGLITRKPSGFYAPDLDKFQNLLLLDQLRGEDSTGAFAVQRDGHVNMVKIGSHPHHLFATKEFKSWRSDAIAQGRILVGHNRKATKGAVNTPNAHPFIEGKYALVHNGTLYNHAKWKSGKEVDSNALAWAFNEYGHEKVIPEIEGAFALVFYNAETETLHMIRNNERPLWLVRSELNLFFASEPWMPEWLLKREHDKIDNVESLKPGQLWSIGLDGTIEIKDIELWSDRYPKSSTHYHSNSGNGNTSDGASGKQETKRPDPILNAAQIQEAVARRLREPDERHIHTFGKRVHSNSEDYGRGEKIQIKAKNIELTINPSTGLKQYKLYGQTIEYGHEQLDVVGWLHPNLREQDLADFYGELPIVGNVTYYVDSVCGRSMWVHGIDFDDDVRTWNGLDIPKHTWTKIVEKECCTKCSKDLDVRENRFCSVNLKKPEVPRVICPDCIVKNLKGALKDGFIERRNAAVQARESSSETPKLPSNGLVLLPGSSAVH